MDKQDFDRLCENNYESFTNKVRKKLKNFPEDITLNKDAVLSDESIEKLMKKPRLLKVNDDYELYYMNDDKEEVFIDPRIEDGKIMSEYVGDVISLLPDIPFDLQCGGVKRKQQEVCAAYTVCIVNVFLEELYNDDINAVRTNYDWENLKSKNVDGTTFLDVLKLIQEDATPIVKFIITCCYTVLSESKEKNEALYIGIVSQKDQEVLDYVIDSVKSIEYKCNKKVQLLENKLDRLQAIKQKDDDVKKILVDKGKKYEVLYRIHKLNSTNLSPKDVATIKQEARKEAKELLSSGILRDNDYYKKYVTRQSQKAIRLLVSSIKKDKFKQFSEVKDNNYDKLIPKN